MYHNFNIVIIINKINSKTFYTGMYRMLLVCFLVWYSHVSGTQLTSKVIQYKIENQYNREIKLA